MKRTSSVIPFLAGISLILLVVFAICPSPAYGYYHCLPNASYNGKPLQKINCGVNVGAATLPGCKHACSSHTGCSGIVFVEFGLAWWESKYCCMLYDKIQLHKLKFKPSHETCQIFDV
ncbi:hypothetical protein CBR_g56718 [Chara braunii]|uniref:Apple domain-containing protein n=1 Tax=Chara braunii TaxID=69332 RepID=A0A388MDP9_CHABU|nr:hypothetical protein CBR_g56718 [Chara braunii]|eukprot:GBG92687.1 hypothetical protein CBR_g56718 [Chara braunii]